MNETVRLYAGRVIPAAQFANDRAQATATHAATDAAETIIAQAEARAADIIAAAEDRARELEDGVKQIADDELIRYVDVQAVDDAARMLQDLFATTAKIRQDFDAFTPWMRDFVKATVTRITGATPPEQLWSGLIHQGLQDIRERWNLVLRVHPSHAELVRGVVAADPVLKDAVKDVQADRNLTPEDCLIQSAQGVTDISVKTQLVTLLLALEYTVDEMRRPAQTGAASR